MPSGRETLGQFLWDLKKEKEKGITEKFATVSACTVLVLRTLLLITQALKYEDQNK